MLWMTGKTSPAREELVYVYHNGKVVSLVRSDRASLSYFGGPPDFEEDYTWAGGPLHHIAHLKVGVHLKSLELPLLTRDLSLIYGIAFSGCRMEYSYSFEKGFNIFSMESQPYDPTFPYRRYPSLLPYIPLEVGKTYREKWETFSNRADNMPEDQPAELVVLVPPPPVTIGCSVWGPTGDQSNVHMVFEYSLSDGRIKTYNVCG